MEKLLQNKEEINKIKKYYIEWENKLEYYVSENGLCFKIEGIN